MYNFCIKWKIADKDLIAMWKKKGYEKLCCMACAQKGEHIQGTTCICRVGRFICFVSIGSEGGFACWQGLWSVATVVAVAALVEMEASE